MISLFLLKLPDRNFLRLQLLLVLFSCSVFSCKPEKREIRFTNRLQKCKPENASDSVFCGYYSTWENKKAAAGKKIEIYVVVIPAIHSEEKKDPVFFFEGGPGAAASNSLSFYSEPGNPYRQYQDVVLIDVRGTGKSNPLHCNSLEFKAGLQDQFKEMYPGTAVVRCRDSLSKTNDLTQYTTENVVQDLEEIRAWLGYDKVNLYGLSYGTRVAQTYMKLFPESIVSATLWSPVAMNAKMPLFHARFAQDAINKIFDECLKDSLCRSEFPDIKNDFINLMSSWKTKSKQFHYTDQQGLPVSIEIPWPAFHTKIRSLSYHPAGMRTIPFIIHSAAKGDLKPFIKLFPKESVMDDFIAEGFYLCITCAEDVPFITEKEIPALIADTYMGNYRIEQQRRACSLWNSAHLSPDILHPVSSAIPTLILSGGLDPVTPMAWADSIAAGLKNCRIIRIPQMGHLFDGLSNDQCFDTIVADFLRNHDLSRLNDSCISSMTPPEFIITGN